MTKKKKKKKIPPLTLLLATFTEQSRHDLPLQIGDGEALKRRVRIPQLRERRRTRRRRGERQRRRTRRRRRRSEKLRLLSRKLRRVLRSRRRLIAAASTRRRPHTRKILLKHIDHILIAPEIQKRPRLKLQRLFVSRRENQSRIEKIQSRNDIVLSARTDQTLGIFHIPNRHLENYNQSAQSQSENRTWKLQMKSNDGRTCLSESHHCFFSPRPRQGDETAIVENPSNPRRTESTTDQIE